MANPPTSLDVIEQWLTIGAVCAGALFFVWKLFTGWLFINLKLSVQLDRMPAGDHADTLAVTLTLEKGSTDSIWLKSISARISWPGEATPTEVDMSEELKWLKVDNAVVNWEQHEPSNRTIALAPGELTTIARSLNVPPGVPVSVQIAAYGARPFWPRGFLWRASAVSLPSNNPKNANKS